jgi:lysosomal acid lipase/cholesteryl ester hydrolase
MKVTPILFLLILAVSTIAQTDGLDFQEIVEYYGYPVETHEVTTSDGYVLTNFRIPYGREDTANNESRPPVL